MLSPYSSPKVQSRFCVQCKEHRVFTEKISSEQIGKDKPFVLWRCNNCGSYALEIDSKFVYPVESGVAPSVYMPNSATDLFIEAQSIIRLSPRATCALLRTCLEDMAVCAGAQGETLAQKLEDLNMSSSLKQLATLCRLFGNRAVHGNQIDFSVGNKEAFAIAEALSTFINRLADEIFGTKVTIQELEQKLKGVH